MQRSLTSDDFEELDLPSNVVSLAEIREAVEDEESGTLKAGSLRPEHPAALTFDEIFKLLVEGQEVRLKFTHRGEYNSLRASLLRRYKGYQEIKLVLGTDENTFLQCSCKGIIAEGNKNATAWDCRFKVQPAELKSNGNSKKYELLSGL